MKLLASMCSTGREGDHGLEASALHSVQVSFAHSDSHSELHALCLAMLVGTVLVLKLLCHPMKGFVGSPENTLFHYL